MKLPQFSPINRYLLVSFLLLACGGIFTAVALLTDRGGISTAAVVISGAVCILTGFFILTFSLDEPLDPEFVAALAPGGSDTVCRITAELGIRGNSWFLPEGYHDGTGVMQLIPVSGYTGEPVAGDTFLTKGPGGILFPPSSAPLIRLLKAKCGFLVPEDPASADALIRETLTEVLGYAGEVRIERSEGAVTVIMEKYLLFSGCRDIFRNASPRCCAIYPCPVCSLCGTILAESTKKPVSLEECLLSEKDSTVRAVFRVTGP